MLQGIAASGGIGIGHGVLIRQHDIQVERRKAPDPDAECRRFSQALKVFVRDIRQAGEAVRHTAGAKEADILAAQETLARDPELLQGVEDIIRLEGVNCEYAFARTCDNYIQLFSALEDELIRARSADFADIKTQILCILTGTRKIDFSRLPAGTVLVAEDISPSQAGSIDPSKICGIVTRQGTRFSHISIIARALQLPAVVAVEGCTEMISQGEALIVDGDQGKVFPSPQEEKLAEYREYQRADRELRSQLEDYRLRETRTADGHRIRLAANLAVEQELRRIVEDRADGIGLYRTEFLYMDRQDPPGEEEQFLVYRRMAQTMGDRPFLVRTLDVGGDKEIPYLGLAKEENPYLGFRGIRYSLTHRQLFQTQLAALLRAAAEGNLQIMLPMVTSSEEIRETRALMAQVESSLEQRGLPHRKHPPLGIMVETPAAAQCADILARESDFFSIGTNDLTQYVLAVDRSNPQVAPLYNCLHPGLLRTIWQVARAGEKAGILVGVCGEAASDPLLLPFLLGAGVGELSVSSGELLSVRRQLAGLSHARWREWAAQLLELPTSGEVAAFIRARLDGR